MKKILLLIVSGLLIACMAGSAMAIGLSFVGATYDDGKAVVNLEGGDGQANMKLYDLPSTGMYALTVSTNSADLQATLLNLNNEAFPGYASLTSVSKDYGPLNPSPAEYPFILYIKGTGVGEVTVVASGPDGTQSQSATVTATTIPEFPTVALPIAAILGLVFIFGRKKEGL